MLTLLKRTDIPVAGGALKPLMRELIIADNVHGESGLDGPALPEPGFTPQSCTAVELMAKVLRESAEPVTPVATGPQTNVALLLSSHPELHSKIARIVIMGGAMGRETGRLPQSSTFCRPGSSGNRLPVGPASCDGRAGCDASRADYGRRH